MWRSSRFVFLGTALCTVVLVSARADDKTAIKGGIEGRVKKVDVENNSLTITTTQGRERTFTITDDTMMIGPRGGKVRRHLKDPRFHEGFVVTVVADGNAAKEVHLGFASEASEEKTQDSKTAKKGSESETPNPKDTEPAKREPPKRQEPGTARKTFAERREAAKAAEQEDEEEILGHIKSFDPAKRILVVTLLNGNHRTFILSQDVPVHIGRVASKRGLESPELKPGASVTVITEEGGHKVKELRITPASEFRRRKSG
jgi:hypothetical protein